MIGGFSFAAHHSQDTGARAAADAAGSAARDARSEVEYLKSEVERLLMISEALWTLVKEQHGYDDEVLAERIRAIDMKDGRLDGRVARSAPAACPSCGRTLSRQRPVCMYCGSDGGQDPFAR
ncbi:MAG: hypothetical protein ACYS9X_15895 [Planctomycetota bacterium]|jgi:hypothetical protein